MQWLETGLFLRILRNLLESGILSPTPHGLHGAEVRTAQLILTKPPERADNPGLGSQGPGESEATHNRQIEVGTVYSQDPSVGHHSRAEGSFAIPNPGARGGKGRKVSKKRQKHTA